MRTFHPRKPRGSFKPKLTDAQRAEIAARFKDEDPTAIGQDYGVGRSTVYRIARAHRLNQQEDAE